MTTSNKDYMTVAQILEERQKELLEIWLENIRTFPRSRTLELMTEEQLRKQTTELLRALTTAFSSEEYEDIERPEFADLLAMLRDISAAHAEQGLSPSETAYFVFSLGSAIRKILIKELAEDVPRMREAITNVIDVMAKLSLVTVETFAMTREEIITQQSRSLMELSTPVIKLWDGIILLPPTAVWAAGCLA